MNYILNDKNILELHAESPTDKLKLKEIQDKLIERNNVSDKPLVFGSLSVGNKIVQLSVPLNN